jgi:hypothetical protein
MPCGGGFCGGAMISRGLAACSMGVVFVGFYWVCNYFMDGGILKEFKLPSTRGEMILKTGMTEDEVENIIGQIVHTSSTPLKKIKRGAVKVGNSTCRMDFKEGRLASVNCYEKKISA